MPQMLIQPDRRQLEQIRGSLDDAQWAKLVGSMMRVLLKRGPKHVKATIAATMNVKPTAIRTHMPIMAQLVQANGADAVLMQLNKRSLPLVYYRGVTWTKPTGVTAQIEAGKPPMVLPHGFRAKVASKAQSGAGITHTGFYRRAKMMVLNAGDKYSSNIGGFRRTRVTPSGYAARLPIKQLYGPPLLGAFVFRGQMTMVGERELEALADMMTELAWSKADWILDRSKADRPAVE